MAQAKLSRLIPHPKPNYSHANLSMFSPAQQSLYAHLLLQADTRALRASGCDPVTEDGSHEDFGLYHRLKAEYQAALERRYHISPAQGLALLRLAYVKQWNIS